jgi:quercetin dioxygenase-like cupin family protein
MIRCVRIWTGADGNSCFEEGSIALTPGARGDAVGHPVAARHIFFQETSSGGSFDWHDAPHPQYVITLSGTLEFKTKSGETFIIRPGDILLAQDTTGSGHEWRLVGSEPWRRAYVVYEAGVDLGYTASTGASNSAS